MKLGSSCVLFLLFCYFLSSLFSLSYFVMFSVLRSISLSKRVQTLFGKPYAPFLLFSIVLFFLYFQKLDNTGYSSDQFIPRFYSNLSEFDSSEENYFRNFRSLGVSTFEQYNAFRMSATRFRIIGVGIYDWTPKSKELKCWWMEDDHHGQKGSKARKESRKIIQGKLRSFRDRQSHQYLSSYMYECTLASATSQHGGRLMAKIDFFEKAVYWEDPNTPSSPPLVLNYTYCLAPMHGNLDERMIVEWMEYHRILMSAQRFVFYNIDSVNKPMKEAFAPYLRSGMVQVIEFQQVMAYRLWYYGQVLASWDCVFSSMDSRWVFLHDLDEYLYFVPPHTIDSVLTQHADVAWISHGMHDWNISLCDDRSLNEKRNGSFLAIESMVYYDPLLFCDLGNSKRHECHNYHGHRKLIVNPRKVSVIETHQVVVGEGEGKHFWNDDILFHNHYRLLVLNKYKRQRCSFFLNSLTQNHYKWTRNEDMKKLATRIHSCPPNASIPCL